MTRTEYACPGCDVRERKWGALLEHLRDTDHDGGNDGSTRKAASFRVVEDETEAATYGEVSGWGTDVGTVALKIAAMPKACGTRPRVVVFTQGSDATLVACGGVLTSFPVPKLAKELLIDTNGAGDAFVGGFLAFLAKGADIASCVSAGNYAARQIIQVSGCKIPSYPPAP